MRRDTHNYLTNEQKEWQIQKWDLLKQTESWTPFILEYCRKYDTEVTEIRIGYDHGHPEPFVHFKGKGGFSKEGLIKSILDG